MKRLGYGASTTPYVDNLNYYYEKVGVDPSFKKYTNRLSYVTDYIPDGVYEKDIDNQELFNYLYDEIGNLIHDEKEGIEEIRWNVSGKVTEVIRAEDSDKPDLEFLYDAMGNRIAKIVKPAGTKTDATTWTTTWYTRDASGNVMSTYEYKNPLEEDSYVLKEQMLYGSSRLGICEVNLDLLAESETTLSERVLGRKRYEESNHLGNVLTVVSDLRLPYDAEGQNLVENGTFNDQYYNYMGLHWEWLPGFDGDAYIKVGDGFNGNAQHIENTATHTKVILRNVFSTIESGKTYRISFKYRSNVNFIATGTTALTNGFIQSIPSNTGDALSYSYERVANGNEGGIYFFLNQTSTGYWFEIDDVSITLLDPDAEIDGYRAHIVSVNDYYAFGGNIQERSHYSPQYRYGFNGQEKEDQITSGSYDFGNRVYDSRLGKWLSMDRFVSKYPYASPYSFAINNPVMVTDIGGDSIWVTISTPEVFKTSSKTITTVKKTLHIEIAVLDVSDAPMDPSSFATKLETELKTALQRPPKIDKTATTESYIEYNVEVNVRVVNSMKDVNSSDHLLVMVDEVNNVTEDGGDASGVAYVFSKIAYYENQWSSDEATQVNGSTHEEAHNFGIDEDLYEKDNNPEKHTSNYMTSASPSKKSFYPEQIERIWNYAEQGVLNQGSNSEKASSESSNYLYHTSTPAEPYDYNVQKGEKIPRTIK